MQAITQAALMGYVLGCINPAMLISHLKGINIRETSYGNPGATNVFMNVGKLAGIFVMLFDLGKAILAVRLANRLFPLSRLAQVMAGVCAMIGHMFPVTMKFKGGKGTACLGGTIIGLNWHLFLPMLAIAAAAFLLTGFICTAPMAAAALFPLVYGAVSHDLYAGLLLTISCALMLWKHRENIRGILEGREPTIYKNRSRHHTTRE